MRVMIRRILTLLYIVLRAMAAYIIRPHFRRVCRYTRLYKKSGILPATILYESRSGASMTCNPYAIFRYVYSHDADSRYTHIWVLNDCKNAELIPEEYRNKKNILFVRYNDPAYVRWLARANYLVNNSTFPSYFQKRKGQVYLNTWHGMPLKNMGIHVPDHYTDKKNVLRNFLHADYLISYNAHTTNEMYLKSYQLEGLYEGLIVEEGAPRIDLTLCCDREAFLRRLKRAGIRTDNKIILYAPTWKGPDTSSPEVEMETLLNDLDALKQGAGEEYTVLFKAHPFLYDEIKDDPRIKEILVPDYLDANELLSVTELLITDYSSIFFDFLVTGRPVLFYMPDEKDYQTARGMYLRPEELPGKVCASIRETVRSIKNIKAVHAENHDVYDEMKKAFCKYEDGHTSERIADIVFYGHTGGYNLIRTKKDRKRILLYPGNMKSNGITTSIVNLLKHIDYDKYDVSIYSCCFRRPDRIENLKRLNTKARLIYKPGRMNSTFKEYCQRKYFGRFGSSDARCSRSFPEDLYKREWEKTFGRAAFDCIIDFCGYDYAVNMLLSCGRSGIKAVYQHNDIQSELEGRFKKNAGLRSLLYNYRYYDKIAAVSRSLMEVNMKKLRVFAPPEKYVCVHNSIDYETILEKAAACETRTQNGMEYFVDTVRTGTGEKIENLIGAPPQNEASFINLGRLSPEKNHRRLLTAFSIVHAKNSACRLYIVGEGVLEDELKACAGELKIEDAVIFTGFIDNPYCLLNRCSCFVLSSDYEGQGLVLLESLILGVPVITTDVTGAKSVCADGYGLIVEKSAEGLAGGMEKFIAGELRAKKFDYAAYNEEAMRQFYGLLES